MTAVSQVVAASVRLVCRDIGGEALARDVGGVLAGLEEVAGSVAAVGGCHQLGVGALFGELRARRRSSAAGRSLMPPPPSSGDATVSQNRLRGPELTF
ncbi:hypothetical protein GCM10009760_36140 [Kitasatospora kazusensis]|uniref:Uncharacterized protein n=1 Tax=Kitasatospora kazusensis TaxID=407974 RepID=A0ABP5LH93_9ACTN